MMRVNPNLMLSRPSSKGAIAIVAAISLVVTIAFLAFSVDIGYINVTESELQNAADAGALSGARALRTSRTEAVRVAKLWAGKNASAKAPVMLNDEDIEIGIWDKSTASFRTIPANSTETPNAVRVTAQRTQTRGNPLTLFFAPILGTNTTNLRSSAVASVKTSSCGDIIALNRIYLNNRNRISYTDAYDSNIGPYGGSNRTATGDVCTNGHITLNGSSAINGHAARWSGSKAPNLNGPITGGISTFPNLLTFPDVAMGNVKTQNANASIGSSAAGQPVLVNGRFSLGATNNPGAIGQKGYMSLASGTPDSITLSPGTYYFNEMAIGSRSTVFITGPTRIYVQGQVDLSYGEIRNVTRKPINLQIYLCDTTNSRCAIHLPTYGELFSVIYAPHSDIFSNLGVSYTLEFYGKMVGQLIRIWSTAIHVDESVAFGSLQSGGEQSSASSVASTEVVLVQ